MRILTLKKNLIIKFFGQLLFNNDFVLFLHPTKNINLLKTNYHANYIQKSINHLFF